MIGVALSELKYSFMEKVDYFKSDVPETVPANENGLGSSVYIRHRLSALP